MSPLKTTVGSRIKSSANLYAPAVPIGCLDGVLDFTPKFDPISELLFNFFRLIRKAKG